MKLKSHAVVEVEHELFGGAVSKKQRHQRMKVSVSDTRGMNNCKLNCSEIELIANRISTPVNGPWIKEFKRQGISFHELDNSNKKIEMLVGNDNLTSVYTGQMKKLESGLGAMESLWGWVMCGTTPVKQEESYGAYHLTSLLHSEVNPVTALWELEAIGITDPATTESKKEKEEINQQHFNQTVKQLHDGRYEVSLPWLIGTKERLTSNYFAVERRLRAVTKDLQQKGYLEKFYSALFQQWETDRMIEEVPHTEVTYLGYYLPHRAVKLSSATTPIRPVFDGSAKGKGGLSLNDCLDKGPNLLELIPPILTRFRLYKVGVTADIKKAFQQISLCPADRDYLKFLWYADTSLKELKTHRHCRVVFGVTSNPYLLGATLRHHLQKATDNTTIARKLINSCYVDNTILSVGSFEEAMQFKQKAVSLLSPAQFDLRVWETGQSNDGKIVPVLGLKWDMQNDKLMLDVSQVVGRIEQEPTLRNLLSLVHGIYDPLGFACPFTILGNILLRKCHENKSGFDTKLPDDLKEEILKWASQIPMLAEMEIPRHVYFGESADKSVHVFCGSSSRASAAAVYLRIARKEGVEIFLLATKSRVAPMNKVTIPRLQLVSCVIASRLSNSILEDMGKPDIPVTYWSDSSTALAWIRGTGPWGVFVSNCVEKVKTTTQVQQWRHIPGRVNIADIPSRGCSVKKLLEDRWWMGPDWLRHPHHLWPTVEKIPDDQLVETERRKTVVIMTSTEDDHPMKNFLRVSGYPRILKYLTLWLRLKNKLQEKAQQRKSGGRVIWKREGTATPLEAEEVNEAEKFLILFI